jgi:thioredoxin-related protein
VDNGLENVNAVIIVFAMDGCPACEDFTPRFHQQVAAFQAYGHPFVYYELGMPLMPGQIPVIVLDGASEDPSIDEVAQRHNVEALPTTILLRRYQFPAKSEGAVDDETIHRMLTAAAESR